MHRNNQGPCASWYLRCTIDYTSLTLCTLVCIDAGHRQRDDDQSISAPTDGRKLLSLPLQYHRTNACSISSNDTPVCTARRPPCMSIRKIQHPHQLPIMPCPSCTGVLAGWLAGCWDDPLKEAIYSAEAAEVQGLDAASAQAASAPPFVFRLLQQQGPQV